MNSGAALQNCYSAVNGTVLLNGTNSKFNLNGGNIQNNQIVANTPKGGGVYVGSGTFIMNDGIIANNQTSGTGDASGGGVYLGSGVFTMYHGSIKQNKVTSATGNSCGGGVAIEGNQSGIFNMYDGKISNNEALVSSTNTYSQGGGIFIQQAKFTMHNGILSGNSVSGGEASGGGVYLSSRVTFAMHDGIIGGDSEADANTAPKYGGAIYSADAAALNLFIMNGGEIKGNEANISGGGLYFSGDFIMNESATISNNAAITGDGGGLYLPSTGRLITMPDSPTSFINNHAFVGDGGAIYTALNTYDNVETSSATFFENNRAERAFTPPPNASQAYPSIGYTNTSIAAHPLNNYDINSISGAPIYYQITYNANGGTGTYSTPNENPGTQKIILSSDETGISRTHHAFQGWNSSSDGNGINYAVDDEIILNNNITLYAKWEKVQFIINFDSNGGSQIEDQILNKGNLINEPPVPKKDGFIFEGWYTDIAFLNQWDFSMVTDNDMVLYAKWKSTGSKIIDHVVNSDSPSDNSSFLSKSNIINTEDMSSFFTWLTLMGFTCIILNLLAFKHLRAPIK